MPRENVLEWTGERLLAGIQGDITLEHLHRYALAQELARAKRVLDVASGEGYGSSLLAKVARSVIGVDIDPAAVAHASRTYALENLEFRQGSATELPLESASIELVVSFETLEHLAEHDLMLAEIRRVLVPGGTLVLSTPDRRTYSEIPNYKNPFHVRELDYEEFGELLGRHFASYVVLGQRVCEGSLLVPMSPRGFAPERFRTFRGDFTASQSSVGLRAPIYLIAIASDGDLAGLPGPSVFEGVAIASNKDLELERSARHARRGEAVALHLERELVSERWAATQREAQKDRRAEELARRVRELEGELVVRDRELARRDEQVELARADTASARAQVDQLQRRVLYTLGERERVEAALVLARHALADRDGLLAHYGAGLLAAEATLAEIRRSRFWRTTQPLRDGIRLARETKARALATLRRAKRAPIEPPVLQRPDDDVTSPRPHLDLHQRPAADDAPASTPWQETGRS
jgi:SAM-dependent methyltransferase